MEIEKENTYNSPEGEHRALICDASIQRENNGEESLKIIFELLSATHPIMTYMARRVYKKSDSRDLLHDLFELVGEDIGNIVGGNRQICEEGLQILRWKECDIEVEHICSPKHRQPFCKVVQVKARGTFIDWPDDDNPHGDS